MKIFKDESIIEQSINLIQDKDLKTTGVSLVVQYSWDDPLTEIILTREELIKALEIVEEEHECNKDLGLIDCDYRKHKPITNWEIYVCTCDIYPCTCGGC